MLYKGPTIASGVLIKSGHKRGMLQCQLMIFQEGMLSA